MHQVFAIFLRDVKRILKNPVALVVTLGVAIIPSLYAWCNILANWDPYANTGNIQVAVANEDKGTTSTLVGHLDAGQQTVNQLKKNHQLGWRFVPEQQAIEGVESGKYYAAIVLPEDFSSRLIGTVTGKGDRPSITYYINEKLNAIAPKITDTGATTIDEQINTTFVSSVADAVAKEVKEAAGETTGSMKNAQSDVINDLTDTINQLETVQQQLRGTRSTLDKALTTIDSAKQSNIALASGITNSLDTVGKASDLLSETRTQTERFSNTLVGALDNGSTQLSGLQVNVSNATGTVLSGLNTTQDALDQVSSTMHHVNTTTGNVLDGVEKALQASQLDPNSQTYKDLSAQLAEARKQLTFQQQRIDAFDQDTTAAINAGKNTANGFNDDVTTLAKNGTASMASARTTITGTVMPNLNTGLDTLSLANGSLSGTLTTLQQGNGLLDQLSRTVTQTNTTIAGTQTQLANLAKQLNTTRTDVAALSSSAMFQQLSQALGLDASEVGSFVGEPVHLDEQVLYPVKNYGSAVTPFYTNLALWVGGFVLVAIYKLEVDRDEKIRMYTPRQGYMGRWLLFVTVGFLQAIIATIGDLALGIQCEHPFLFILAGIFASFVYVNIIYALAVAFRHIGKAVAVILVIIQIPGAAGLYPIEMMPEFFRRLKPFLPFTYGINAMRGPIGGMYANHYWIDMLSLFWYLPVALFIGLVVRKLALNLNRLFDNRLADTDLMITEHNEGTVEPLRLTETAQQIAEEFPELIRRRAIHFFRLYPRLVRWGFLALAVLPFVFLLLLFITRMKLAMLLGWIISIIAIDTYLIVVEYLRERYANYLGEEAMSAEEFRSAILHENLLFRPGMHYKPMHAVRTRLYEAAHGGSAGHAPEHAAEYAAGNTDGNAGRSLREEGNEQ
ncbi:YhgE/Pip domain-containing protein [Bifidobacterium pseudocatenulatum]|uniref:YhgE/Pip domain-containing protein n=1 Tax=Bifidobacterium TaxID=1678 RepID=UPI001CFC7E08|nr:MULTISPECIES: YhgE/Pip domain-containing protein [Bifidobacterium]MCB4886360.1 YhgE/Pip domain-containing protein [Bifidobacterium pseudocatenulatum]MDH7872330.1 YhgE/Pip domain-containing protein [Bifidobacterium catenulatum subsp. kashiwanohense]